MKSFNYDVVIIGGGPAGMAASLAAEKEGATVLILERNVTLGGILVQCIHNGFGLHYFKEELTGPEYAGRFVEKVNSSSVKVLTDTMVVSVSKEKVITAINPALGCFTVTAKAIVLAMGCRERAAGAIQLCGTRPAGVYTAGSAQRIVNIEGYKIGKKVVILGSGDIGLIMARRMTFEGAKVQCVCEIMPYSGGLKRNIVQCLNDFDIPLYFSTSVTKVVGKDRVEGVYIAPLGEGGVPVKEKERFVECDTLLLSVGLIPENDLVADMFAFDKITSGAVVDEHRQTEAEGIFACGNVLHVHDLVDNVSAEGEIAGKYAALYAEGKLESGETVNVIATSGVRYALPQRISLAREGKVRIFFRVGNTYRNARLNVTSGDTLIFAKKYQILNPGEMEAIDVDVTNAKSDITLALEL